MFSYFSIGMDQEDRKVVADRVAVASPVILVARAEVFSGFSGNGYLVWKFCTRLVTAI